MYSSRPIVPRWFRSTFSNEIDAGLLNNALSFFNFILLTVSKSSNANYKYLSIRSLFYLQEWAMGVVHFKILCAFLLMGPDWWLKASFEEVLQSQILAYLKKQIQVKILDLHTRNMELSLKGCLRQTSLPHCECTLLPNYVSLRGRQNWALICSCQQRRASGFHPICLSNLHGRFCCTDISNLAGSILRPFTVFKFKHPSDVDGQST